MNETPHSGGVASITVKELRVQESATADAMAAGALTGGIQKGEK